MIHTLRTTDLAFPGRKPAPIVDAARYVIGLFAGIPHDNDWHTHVTGPAAALMEEAAEGIYDHQKIPRCGGHRSKTVGESMGGGQQTPCPFFHTILTTIVLTGLLAQKPFQRIAGFTNAMFQCYAPDLHDHYHSTLDALHRWNKNLKRNFLSTALVFAAVTFNFGPATVTLPHLDFANLAWGWCAITALGDFDPDKGGHLILWDLKLIIRFPPGATIFIPSALLRHSNTSIQKGEKHFSFTQYTAAGIFCFVDNGFKTDCSINESGLSAAEKAQHVEERKNRWAEGLKMYRRWDVAFE
ncbi:hypothetical protein B0H14DRAFT_2403378 [Mycena olivaceomarginata]|nr:hypothetical protein B0H14DRAFT_2403378 [Mycena olivaceomarginata]